MSRWLKKAEGNSGSDLTHINAGADRLFTLSDIFEMPTGHIFHQGVTYMHTQQFRGHIAYICIKRSTANWTILAGSHTLTSHELLTQGLPIPFISTVRQLVRVDWEALQFYIK